MATKSSPGKPTRITPEEQIQFLLSCIRYSNSGKIDFSAVAQECNIVSKAAAAKRYERLLKANNINPSGGSLTNNASVTDVDGSSTKGKKRKAMTTATNMRGKGTVNKEEPGMKKKRMVVERAESLVEKKSGRIKKEESEEEDVMVDETESDGGYRLEGTEDEEGEVGVKEEVVDGEDSEDEKEVEEEEEGEEDA